eukprot:GAHX01000330.1.p1 GENE.GAHX01000330.1~~GAHX01000330.1.p1  ORF type:complete len:480 (-),score=73.76 GAHX01000330.1:39-1436(-)
MKTANPAFSNTEMVQGCTGEGIEKREMVNQYFIVLPVITYSLIIIKFAMSLYYMSKLYMNPFKTEYKIFFYLFIFVPLASVLLFPVYFSFLYYLRQQLKLLFVVITFACLAIGLAGAIMVGEIQPIVGNGVVMLITAVWFYCMWNQIQMAVTTIKAGLVQLDRKKIKFFLNFFLLLALSTLALGFEITGTVNFSILLDQKDLSEQQQKIAIFFFVAGSIALIYQIELTAAIGYIYGAAFFNQFSLMKDGKIEPETSKEVSQVTNQARRIAFKSSLGTACIGALLITIVRLIEGSANSDNNDSAGAKIAGAVCSCIAEALAFIATQAYVYSAMYGKGLFQSGKMALESFKTSGFDKFFNYAFSERILNMMGGIFATIVGLCSGFIAYKWGGETLFGVRNFDKDFKKIMSMLLGFFVFFCIEIPLYTVNCVLGGHTSAQIALYVEDPDLLKRTHPRADKFTKLLTAQ